MKFNIIPKTDDLYDLYNIQYNLIDNNRGDSGFDLICPHKIEIKPNEKVLVDLEVKIQLLSCFSRSSFFVIPRSSLGSKTSLIMTNSIGLIDSKYNGYIKIPLYNLSNYDTVTVTKGQRLCQITFPSLVPIQKKHISILDTKESFEETTRGQFGFGSTG